MNAKARWHGGERAGHPDFARLRIENDLSIDGEGRERCARSWTVIDISFCNLSAVGGEPNSAMCV